MSTEARPRRRGPYAKTAERRRTIASAALEIVLEKGHEALALDDVAARAGVTVAMINYHFPTRDELLVALLRVRETAYTSQPPSSVKPWLWIEDLVRDRTSNTHYLRVFGLMTAQAADPGHPAHEWAQERYDLLRQWLATLLGELQAAGQAHPEVNPEHFARQFVAAWDGLQTQWLLEPSFDLADEVSTAFRALARVDAMEARRALEALAAGI